ncbi:flippase activity-associated protein Agl23 [Haloplanus rubicundus]|uniref:TIGR03663 family protein n=1 Tax=Haloplanus rubicundus TaxID=1547898 RepID=A0A345EE56_9EURY|nr:flippase activity-associated protein Agl23 [Haloplanus rubicundus]AXG10478.1 TIGR03663 family protein [Haloplanus rubicundus]
MPFDARRRALQAVLAITALALAVRLVGLGVRIFHWDEGRVAYWILRYHESGQFAYRPIVHGPFLFIVNDWVFSIPVLGASDFSARLIVAVVGGLLPLSAWLLRDHLRDAELVALAVVLAINPLLVYYSRFMRNDVLVGAFAFVALAMFVRALDRGDARLVYPAAAAMGLAFTTKENAVVYVLCYLGAGALLIDHRLFRAARSDRSVRQLVLRDWRTALAYRLQAWGGSVRRGIGLTAVHTVGALVAFFAVVTFFYAPRPELWTALAAPSRLPGVVEAATVGSWESFYSLWVAGSHQNHDYLPFLYDYLETLLYGAPFVLLFALVGFVADGYGDDGYRDIVAFATYWGAVSIVGYPIATDIRAPWAAVHAVIPLAVPAAVGIAAAARRVRETVRARAGDDPDTNGLLTPAAWTRPAALAALVLCAAAVGTVGANAAYANSASDAEAGEVIQWAQPENDLKDTLELVRGVVRANEGTDVLFVGTHTPGNPSDVRFYVANESTLQQPRPGGPSWHTRLPLPWYLERYDAEVTSTAPDASLPADPPPVVVAAGWDEDRVARELSGYERHRHDFRLWSDEIVVFVDESALERAREQGYV